MNGFRSFRYVRVNIYISGYVCVCACVHMRMRILNVRASKVIVLVRRYVLRQWGCGLKVVKNLTKLLILL